MSSIKKNYIYNMLYQVFLVILPLITTPYVSRVLGSEGIGTYSFTLSITTYFILAGTLGISMYGRREIAFRQDNREERSKVFWQINLIKWIAMSISIFVFYFTCIKNTSYGTYFTIFTIELLANMFDIGWYFQGMEQFKTLSIRNFIVKILSVISIFTFVKSPNDLWIYILIYCLSTFASVGTLWILLPRTISKVRLKLKDTKKHIWPIFLLFLPQVTIEIYTVLDKTMLGLLVNNMSEVGIYEQSQKIERMTLNIVTALGPVMGARVANLFADNKSHEIATSLKKAFHFVWFLAVPIVFGIIAIAPNLVPWFLGDEFLPAIPVMQIGAILVLIIAISNVSGYQFLVPTKRQNAYTLSVVLGALTNFIGNLFMIPLYGAIGAIITSVAAELVVTVTQLCFIRRDFKLREVFRFAKFTLPFGAIMCIVVLAFGNFLPKTIIGTLIQIAVGGLIYIIGLTIVKDDFIWKTIGKIKTRIRK